MVSGGFPTTLVLFDFSGTLSLGAPLFGGPSHLEKALEKSGFKELGVASAHDFWHGCVIPYWPRGSTTPAGYARLLAEALEENFGTPLEEARQKARNFCRLYFEASSIDPAWKPLLSFLHDREHVYMAVVTDHYEEAGEHLRQELQSIGLPSCSLEKSCQEADSRVVRVAPSARLGAVKAEKLFWQGLRNLLPRDIGAAHLVEDFGANENEGDPYKEDFKVKARREQSVAHITKVFGVAPTLWNCALEIPMDMDTTVLTKVFRAKIQSITTSLKEVFA